MVIPADSYRNFPESEQTTVTIDPPLAETYLARQKINRPLNKRRVAVYADDMRSGAWELNGEPIIFDQHGFLIDGQHRLRAIIDAQCPITTFVVHGVDEKTFHTIDRGAKRTVADVLTINGVAHGNTIAAALGWLWRYTIGECQSTSSAPSVRQIEDALKMHPGIIDACTQLGTRARHCYLPPGIATWLYYEFARRDTDLADHFFDGLVTGADLKPGSPILVLRKKLIDTQQQARGQRMERPFVRIAWAIKAWNAFKRSRSIKNLRFQVGESFPVIVGSIQGED